MADEQPASHGVSRRSLLRGATGAGLVAAAARLFPGCGSGGDDAAADAPPETATIRLPRIVLTAATAQAAASEFLKQEGFNDVQYVNTSRPEAIFRRVHLILLSRMMTARLPALAIGDQTESL